MNREFLTFYERELSLLWEQAAEFAETYPKLAERLGGLQEERGDPMISGLLEGAAPGTARVPRALAGGTPPVPGAAYICLLATLASTAPARADFRVCNTTRVMANIAVGHAAGEDFVTEGWWTVAPGDCATPIHGALSGRFPYVYADGADSRELFPGSVTMCVDRVKFKVTGVADCWRRGLTSVAFYEIDTGSAADWTTFLGDPGK